MGEVKTASGIPKKRKRKIKTQITTSEPKSLKLVKTITPYVKKGVLQESLENTNLLADRYPILKDEELIKKFLSVNINNNQKGRIRQVLKDSLKGTSDVLLPDVINYRIQAILKNTANLTDSDLRKLRILYNMLKTATKTHKVIKKKVKNKTENKTDTKETKKKHADKEKDMHLKVPNKDIKTNQETKVKGPKRYVVFLGNLPLDVDKEKILKHFSEMSGAIKDIRIPKRASEKKSCIAYLELENEPTYELALSKHHTMMGSRRINVLYSTQKQSKISKSQAKSKSAKLIALQKSGKLVGSAPLARRRSQRRKREKAARAKLNTT